MVLDLCNLCSVSYNTNEVLTAKYTNKEIIFDKCGKCPILKETPSDCQYFTTYYNDSLLICFRGTESKKDILLDINISRSKFIVPNYNIKMYVHEGFLTQFNEVCHDLTNEIESYKNDISIDNKKKKIIFTGHSLGGALATLGTCYFSILNRDLSVNCITYGSPRVGCNEFKKKFNKYCDKSFRYVNENDPVPSLPSSWRYKHVKGCNWINNDKIVNEIMPWRFYRFCKSYILSFFGYGYNAIDDHYCKNYIINLDIVNH